MRKGVAYVAGFFDGDGCVGIYRNGSGGFHLRTQVTQNVTPASTALLKGMQSRWDGGLSVQRTTHGTKYNWQLSSSKAAAFLRDILPHLVLKREQAVLCLEWEDTRPKAARDDRGRMVSLARPEDETAAEAVKNLKRARC